MDCAAEQLGIDPVEIRRRNLIRSFPYRLVTGLLLRRGQLSRERWSSRRQTIDIAAFRDAAAGGARARALSRHRLLACSASAPATARPPLPRAAWRSRPATSGSRSPWTRPATSRSRIGASPHGQGLAARRSRQLIADELGVEPATDPHHPRRHRRDALWLGHLRQPLDGDLRRRLQARGRSSCATSSRRLAGHAAGGRPRRHRDRRRAGARARHRHDDRSAELARAAYHQSHRFGDAHDPDLIGAARPTIRPAPSPTPATPRSSRSMSRPAASRSSASSWSRTPAC